MRIKSVVIFSILILNAGALLCQRNFDGFWISGYEQFYFDTINGKTLQFEGGSLHEGGADFYGEMLSDKKIRILGARPGDEDWAGYGERNWTLEYKKISSFEILILKDTTDAFKGLLRKGPPRLSLRDYIEINKINYQLAGKYAVAGTNYIIKFFPDEKKIIWNGKNHSYEFETEYDAPVDIITIGDASYFYERKFKTLYLYKAFKKDDDEFGKGKLLFKLALVEKLPRNTSGLEGDYPFSSTILLTNDILGFYSLDELNIIRNEIFARHGYLFTNPELKRYFESKVWYKPLFTDVSDKLSEIERINIEQIKLAELDMSIMRNK